MWMIVLKPTKLKTHKKAIYVTIELIINYSLNFWRWKLMSFLAESVNVEFLECSRVHTPWTFDKLIMLCLLAHTHGKPSKSLAIIYCVIIMAHYNVLISNFALPFLFPHFNLWLLKYIIWLCAPCIIFDYIVGNVY